jgi:hypothetical protein
VTLVGRYPEATLHPCGHWMGVDRGAWVRPSPVAAADVEAVSVAPAQPEGDTSSAAGRAGTVEPWVARPEL